MGTLADIKAGMADVYERQAEIFDQNRSKTLFEKPWLDRFCDALPDRATVLDLGCGSGKPIAEYLIRKGMRLTGVDQSIAMLDIARKRWPDIEWLHADMRNLSLNKNFDGVVAWNSFFHLSPDEQRSTLPRLLDHVGDGGAFLTTVGHDEGEADGWVGGEPVYHGSLAQDEYERLCSAGGFQDFHFVPNDPDCAGHSVFMARR